MRQTPDCLENNPSSRIPLGTIPSASLSSAFRAPANAPEDFVLQFPDYSSVLLLILPQNSTACPLQRSTVLLIIFWKKKN